MQTHYTLTDIRYMKRALELAESAGQSGEVPVGAVVVDKAGRIIGEGQNRRQTLGMATAHAEIEAIETACRSMGNWRLAECTLYVTLEPCPMCAGAILSSRLMRLVYAAKEENTGCAGSVCNLFAMDFPNRPTITAGIMEAESLSLLHRFFTQLRE